MKLKISDNVFSITEEINNYYKLNVSSSYANKVMQNFYKIFKLIQTYPHIGRYVPEIKDKRFREKICCGYRIIYFISEEENSINIRYILSNKQNSTQFIEVHKREIIDIINFLNQII